MPFTVVFEGEITDLPSNPMKMETAFGKVVGCGRANALDDREVLGDEVERLEQALQQIDSWSRAYPLKVFPEPDFKKAAELLNAGGMTLDAISASNMRHVVEGVGKIAQAALSNGERS